jgi:CRP-like cAMP-binding protein
VIATVDFESPDFLELLRKYPKAFTKMKRVFATRLQRVTLHLMQHYFDLADHFIDKRASPWQSTRPRHGNTLLSSLSSTASCY